MQLIRYSLPRELLLECRLPGGSDEISIKQRAIVEVVQKLLNRMLAPARGANG